MANWGRMPYPKFLETSECLVFGGGDEVWRGKVFFGYRAKGERERDGTNQIAAATATTDQDLMGLLGDYEIRDLEMDVPGGRFLVVEMRPFYNPDGSFHHLEFGLIGTGEFDDLSEG